MKTLGYLFIAILIMAFAINKCNAQWSSGGTLHGSTVIEWNKASKENKLATCADFASTVWGREIKAKGRDWEKELLVRSYYLMTCIDEAVRDQTSSRMRVARVAAACTKLY